MFCNYLEAANVFGIPRERLLFLERGEEKLSGRQLELKRMPFSESLKQVFMDSESGYKGMSGIKLMASTLRRFPRSILDIRETPGEEFFFRQVAAFLRDNVGVDKFIYWRRRNKIEQALSHYYLRKTGVAHIYNDNEAARYHATADALSIDPNDIERELYRLMVDEQMWARFFVSSEIDPLVLYYEDFVSEKKQALMRVFDYLGCSPDEASVETIEEKVAIKKISKSKTKNDLEQLERFFMSKYEGSFDSFFGFDLGNG